MIQEQIITKIDEIQGMLAKMLVADVVVLDEGGAGSGNWGHKGRKGKRGGSAHGGGKSIQRWKIADFETDRLLVKQTFLSSKGERMMFEAFDKQTDVADWLRLKNPPKVVDLTIDINTTTKTAYLNRIDATGRKGFGSEALKAVVSRLESRGIVEFTGYIEKGNTASQRMMKKLGASIYKRGKKGDYWKYKSLSSDKRESITQDIINSIIEGGAGSGHWGHRGRKGKKGGSASGFIALPGERKDLQPEIKKRGLVIPVVWKAVRLNADPNAGLQVLGIDTKGRQQPIYSVKHSKESSAEKFARLKEFTKKVPGLQKRIEKDFNTSDEAKALYLISKTGFRVGSGVDTKAAVKAYGASTLEAKHVTMVAEGTVEFKFTGKKGVANSAVVTDKKLARHVAGKKTGKIFNTNDSKIRRYLKKIDGEFKVKDFRTFIGTSEALKAVNKLSKPKTAKERNKAILSVCKKVAKKLGNTISVARSAYIAPEVWDKWAVIKS